jgi:ribose transport system ATP-binding protein
MVLQMTAAAEDLHHQSEGERSISSVFVGECSGTNIHGAEPSTQDVLVVEQLDSPPKVRSGSLSVRRGEVLGVAGLVGSGRTELLRLIFGADRAHGGSVWAEGEPRVGGKQKLKARALFRSPREAVMAGVVMVSEDRKSDGLLLDQSIAMNIQLPQFVQGWLSVFHRYVPELASQVANRYIEQLAIRCESCEQSVASLSGGNQQKVVLAKWLERSAKVFLLDEPTRGIDSAAREMVYRVIRQLASEGKGVLVVSSDLEELTEISDRIVVLSNGRLTEEFSGPAYDKPSIVASMFSGYGSER